MEGKDKLVRPDDVSDEYPEGSIRLMTRITPPESEGVPTLVIEGDAQSLEYLAKVILAQARFPLDCGYGIDPKGAGNAFFSPKAEVGIYIHRLPCMDGDEETASHEEAS